MGYSQRGAILKSRTIKPYLPQDPTESYYWDIKGMIGYLEIPIMLQYKFLLSKEVSVSPLIGIDLSYPKKDLTDLNKKKYYSIEYPAVHNYDTPYDYRFQQESTFGNNDRQIIYTIGLRFQYQRFGLELKYYLNNTNIYEFDRLDKINYRIDSFYTQLTFEL